LFPVFLRARWPETCSQEFGGELEFALIGRFTRWGEIGVQDKIAIELTISDPSQISWLARYLHLAAPEAAVMRSPGEAKRGELGTLDVLTVIADSGVLIAMVNSLPAFLGSRKPGVTATVKTKNGDQVTVTGSNGDEVASAMNRILNE
jgi:hypothetical protein